MGEFIDHVRAAGSPTQQLKLLNRYRPASFAAGSGGAGGSPSSEEAWDAAVYATLDRASLLKRLLRNAAGGDDTDGASSSSSAVAPLDGPVAALLPRDRLGSLLLDATRRCCSADAAAALLHLTLGARHTECLLTEAGRAETAEAVAEAVRALLQRL